ncbi:MAG: hypothetical protein ACOZF2_18845 [Thermodesulfobacteriota bacterium]
MEDDIRISWERFLNPDVLRTNLIVASLYITAFEMLKESIIERPKEYFSVGYDKNGLIVDEKYNIKVLSLNKSPLYASLSWLKDMDAIDSNDIDIFDKIIKCRNDITHEIVNYISKGVKTDPLPLFNSTIDLLHKIEKWWILNIEIAINPELNEKEVKEDEIVPGKIMILRLLLDIALGSEKESRLYYNEFIKKHD